MHVSLIITTYNRSDALSLVLKSIEGQSTFPSEIIIADDGSHDDTREIIHKFQSSSSLKIIHSWQKDNGFRVSKSRNKAIAQSTSEYIILIDGDMILHPEFVQDHINNSQIGYFIQGNRVLLTKRATKNLLKRQNMKLSFLSKGIKNRKNAIYSVLLSKLFSKNKNYLHGIKTCNMSFFKKDCLRVNGFDNNFEGWGREDSEYALRLMNSGINRKNLRFNGIQFHLWHLENNRVALLKNDLILKSSITCKSKWCDNGVKKYL